MDTQQQTESALANATAAEIELAEYIANNRQHIATHTKSPKFNDHRISFEAIEAAAERERMAEERAAARARQEIIERLQGLISAAGKRYADCRLDSFACTTQQQNKVVYALREYVTTEAADNVILYGPVGTGKDHLAFAVCRAAVASGRTVRWINGQKWFGLIRDAMETDKSEASLIADLAKPDLLCLSDPLPPVGPLTQFQTTMLYRLVDARYSRSLPTICTINVATDDEADSRMGAATWDRLTHGAWKLHCSWPTYRQPAREV